MKPCNAPKINFTEHLNNLSGRTTLYCNHSVILVRRCFIYFTYSKILIFGFTVLKVIF